MRKIQMFKSEKSKKSMFKKFAVVSIYTTDNTRKTFISKVNGGFYGK